MVDINFLLPEHMEGKEAFYEYWEGDIEYRLHYDGTSVGSLMWRAEVVHWVEADDGSMYEGKQESLTRDAVLTMFLRNNIVPQIPA